MARKTDDKSFESSTDYFDSYRDEMVGVINLKGDVFEMANDLLLKEAFFGKVRLASRLPEIKTLLVFSKESAMGVEGYARFAKTVTESSDGSIRLVREENALSQYIRLIFGSEKLVVSGVRGSAIAAFLGAILSADYRVASESTVFSFKHLEDERSPQGALGFFLPRYLSLARAKQLLFSGESLTAAKALELGLVDEVVPGDVFEEKCIEAAKRLSGVHPGIVHLSKLLMKCELNSLDAYIKMETNMGRPSGPNNEY